CQQYYDTPLAF
nr:immunoglobulin light chain junction region [Macaca mulatta]MPO02484.1 immunoglobulin light chain junction region [Macaca mulatta]